MRRSFLWAGVAAGLRLAGAAEPSKLRFLADGSFHISVFEDLHFGEGEDNPPEWGWGPISDQKSLKVMNTILDVESPDLVVLNGDLITGENTFLENSTHYLDQIVGPIASRKIPFATAYGNHDIQYNLSTDALYRREKALWPKLSWTKKLVDSPKAGVSNYYLPVWSRDSSNDAKGPPVLLWFFDSGGGNVFQKVDSNGQKIQVPGVVDQSVVDWFTATSAALNKKYKTTIPSLAFVHIPTYASAAAQLTGAGIDNHTAPGINDDCCPTATQGITNGEYTGADIPFMRALINTPGLMAVFSGHDHGNDWCYRWKSKLSGMTLTGNGIDVCFGRHSGYGGYGSWTRGSRQIRLKESWLARRMASTWVRLEDENVSGHVMLNSTYGTDRYPVVKNTHT